MAIIRAYPEFDDWFVHHLNNLYITSEYNCDFGWFGKKYNIVGHYEDILDIEEKLYRDYNETSIIPEICKRINQHTYTIIDIDSSKVYKNFQKMFVAQFLIYGYDGEKRVFYVPSSNGGWHEEEISWEDFIEAFKVRKGFTREQKKAVTARQNPYPIMFLKPKLHVKPQIQLSRLYNDLKAMLNVKDVAYYFENQSIKDFYFYEGILGVCTGLMDLIQRVYDGKFDINDLSYDHGLASGFCKILEYNILLYENLKRVERQFELNIPGTLYEEFEKVLSLNRKLRNTILVYKDDRKKGHLLNGIHFLKEIKKKEQDIFIKLVAIIEDYFCEA